MGFITVGFEHVSENTSTPAQILRNLAFERINDSLSLTHDWRGQCARNLWFIRWLPQQ